MNAENKRTIGMLAAYDGPSQLLKVAEKLRDAGYSDFDCHSPYPIHGMDDAMGEQRSPLGFIVGAMGLAGGGLGILLQWWTSAVDYPLVISGKPYFSLPAFIPVAFELTILLAAFGAVFGMFFLNRLPSHYHPVFYSEKFGRVSDDAFYVSILASDSKFDTSATRELLESAGGFDIEILEEEIEVETESSHG